MRRYCWLEQLHTAHYATLLRLAQHRLYATTGSTSEAEDVVQEVFLLAAEKDISQIDNPLRWLISATVNLCKKRVDQIIRESTKKQRFVHKKLIGSTECSVYAVEREESKTDAADLLVTMEQTLSKEDWDILRRYSLEGVPIEEISEQLGIPINTLRVRICRIRKKLEKTSSDM